MRLIYSILYSVFITYVFASKSHPVTTFLNAKWHTTPVCLEIAEYLFDESPNLFWDYVHELNNFKTPLYEIESDSKAYKSSLAVAEKFIGATQLSLLKLSLSMHSLSPRVQAHFQIARDVVKHGDCQTDSFVTINHRVACSLDETKKGIELTVEEITNKKKSKTDAESGDDEEEEVYSFDHVFPGSENNTITAILYSEIGSKSFAHLHGYLQRQAEKGQIKYVFRHYVRVSLILS